LVKATEGFIVMVDHYTYCN